MFYFLFFTQIISRIFWKKIFGIFCQKAWKIPSGLFRKSVSRRFWIHGQCLSDSTDVCMVHGCLSVWRIKSPAGIFSHIHIRASGCESLYTKRKPRRPCQGFLRKYCYETMEKIFVLFFHFLFLFILLFFSLVYSHDFNLNSYRLPVRDFNLNPPLAIAKSVLLCHHQILNPASLLLQ